MFTGIIQKIGRIAEIKHSGGSGRLVIETTPWVAPLELGESIAINGCCLTVASFGGSQIRFDVLEETFQKTSLGEKRGGQRVNLERALCVGDSMGGHFVTGHVDGTGEVREVRQIGRDFVFRINSPAELLRGMVPKGSIALDGISLTIVELTGEFFSVHIIPHTIAETALSDLKAGDSVNLETDMIGKYVQRFLGGGEAGGLTWEKLRAAGFS